MDEMILIGSGSDILSIHRREWEEELAGTAERIKSLLAFMSDDHHRVRSFVVSELPRTGKPIAPAHIAASLELEPGRVGSVLDDLERNLFFLVRDRNGAVSWAFPVTADPTPHRLDFSSGERLWGA